MKKPIIILVFILFSFILVGATIKPVEAPTSPSSTVDITTTASNTTSLIEPNTSPIEDTVEDITEELIEEITIISFSTDDNKFSFNLYFNYDKGYCDYEWCLDVIKNGCVGDYSLLMNCKFPSNRGNNSAYFESTNGDELKGTLLSDNPCGGNRFDFTLIYRDNEGNLYTYKCEDIAISEIHINTTNDGTRIILANEIKVERVE